VSRGFILGLDLGQSIDYTALAVLAWTKEGRGKRGYGIRHLERFRGVTYDEIARRVARLVETPELQAEGRPYLALDATGVGRPVLDLLRAARIKASLLPILIHGGQTVTWPNPETAYERPEIGVPKRDLCSAVQVLLQTNRLKVGSGVPLAETLAAELRNFRVRISLSGSQTFGAGPSAEWREGAHDDLILAVACAAWAGEHGRIPDPEDVARWAKEAREFGKNLFFAPGRMTGL
jgi:hypothetical protein